MSYIAVDSFGHESIFQDKPERKFSKNKEWGCWILNKEKGNTVQVPKGTAKALFNAGLMIDCKIPLDKRDMNWGDNPILI